MSILPERVKEIRHNCKLFCIDFAAVDKEARERAETTPFIYMDCLENAYREALRKNNEPPKCVRCAALEAENERLKQSLSASERFRVNDTWSMRAENERLKAENESLRALLQL